MFSTSRQLRERLGLDRYQWARALGVGINAVDYWELEPHEPVGLAAEVMRGIAAALDVIPADQHRQIGQKIALGIGALITYGIWEMVRTATPA